VWRGLYNQLNGESIIELKHHVMNV
jgi:hypothetical protein